MAAFTQLHVILSLVGIATGFVVVLGLIAAKQMPRWTVLFLITTALTSITGFMFPFKGVTPGIVIGILSIITLLLAVMARYGRHLAGPWRGVYVIATVLAQFFNFFVLIVQSFEKVPALKALAPTQAELPFKAAQLAALALFTVLTVLAYRKFHAA
jgi:hypothetical protein